MPHEVESYRSGPVVVGVDGSEATMAAVRWAAREADAHHVKLRLVHAIGMPDFFPAGAMAPSAELFHLLQRDAEAVLTAAEEQATEAAPGVSVLSNTTAEAVVLSLIEESRGARCVVLGPSAHGSFTGLLFGSATVTLAAHAHCPVVSVRGSELARAADVPVVVGVDGSALSDEALGWAFAQASFAGVELVAVHAWSDRDSTEVFSQARMSHEWEPLEQAEQRVLAERLAGWSERYPNVTVERDVVRAKPRERLLEWSSRARLVVVGSRGRGGFTGMLLGSTSQALLHQADCPVMVVRPDGHVDQARG